MSDAQSNALIQLVQRLTKVVATVAGAVVGVGTLAFSAGFLAQRAQYDFAQVPFVFIDYWAYAETGLMALVRSINLFVGHPWCLAFIGVASIVLVLALESRGFRDWALHAHWVFLGYLLLICWLGLLLQQQTVVRQLRDGPLVTAVDLPNGNQEVSTTTVPALLPFRLALPPALPVPAAGSLDFTGSSLDLWTRIADDLEKEIHKESVYLEVRPNPSWAILGPVPTLAGEAPNAPSLIGVEVDPDRLESARAQTLYRVLLSSFVIGLWAFVVLSLWQRRVFQRISQPAVGDSAPSSGFRGLLHRLREELWFVSRWVLQGIAVLLLLATGVFLMPECYGLLAMPRLGEEYVEVISGSGTREAAATDGAGAAPVPGEVLNVEEETLEALVILNNFTSSEHHDEEVDDWRRKVADLESRGTAEAAHLLRIMANASTAISADLSDMASEALRRVASQTFSATEGFILYYPRSETDYLRILQRNPASTAKRWTIYPVKMGDIVEIRVKRDERTVQLLRILRRLPDLQPGDRASALLEAEKLGHGRLLEVALAGTYDPSHRVRGVSITDVGRYAAGLPRDEAGTLRRWIAASRLLEILRDPKQRTDHRGVAATALHKFVAAGDPDVCRAMVESIEADSEEFGDEAWAVRGSVITAAGLLRCREAVPRLLELLDESDVPVHVRGTIPTQLSRLGSQHSCAAKLGDILNDQYSPPDVVGPSITALSLLEGADTTVAVDALLEFLTAEEYGDELEAIDQVSDFRVTAVDSLRQIGNPHCLETLHILANRIHEDDYRVRAKAAIALGEFENPGSEELLIRVAEDDGEDDRVRYVAISALASYHRNDVVRRLAELHPGVASELQGRILETLERRGRTGSSYARSQAQELEKQRLRESLREGVPSTPVTVAEPGHRESVPLTLEVGEEVSGTLDEEDQRLDDGSYVEVLEFRGEAGQEVTLDLLSEDFDGLLSVLGPGLALPLMDDDSGGRCNSRITTVLPQSATYRVLVNSAGMGPATGSFVLRILERAPPSLPGACNL